MSERLPVKWFLGVPADFPLQPMPELTAEEKFLPVARHYFKTHSRAKYPWGTFVNAGRELGLSDERIHAIYAKESHASETRYRTRSGSTLRIAAQQGQLREAA